MKLTRLLQSFIISLGDFSLFVFETFRSSRGFWRRRNLFLKHCDFIGVTSLAVVVIAGMFMGAVLGYQLYVSFHYFGAEALLGGSVGVSLFRELGPVLTAIMVTGRAGAAIAAELSSMRISEQIDALEVMAVDPIEYLVVPRVVAGLVMVPLLAIFYCIVGSWASSAVACGVLGLDWQIFWKQYAWVVDRIDLIHCVVKSSVFGVILTWVGCFFGFRAQGGASAVGLATRSTVVVSILVVLLGDYILTSFLPFGFAKLRAF